MAKNSAPMALYMAVTPDKYELPLAIADSKAELARICNEEPSTISRKLRRAGNPTTDGPCRFVEVPIDTSDWQEIRASCRQAILDEVARLRALNQKSSQKNN